MAEEPEKRNGKRDSSGSRRKQFRDALKRRQAIVSKKRDDGRNYSLEGMRFAAVMNQLQALQALQGLKELAPGKRDGNARFEFSTVATERAAQYQWLSFKADWLEAVLADTLDQLDALAEFERDLRSLESLREKNDASRTNGERRAATGRPDAKERANGEQKGEKS